MTDASVKRLLKKVAEKIESENILGYRVGSLNSVELYKEWIKDEINHNGNQWIDWRSSDVMMELFDKLSNPQYITGLSASTNQIMTIENFKRDLLIGILYDWQQKTVAIDKLHNAQNQLAELVS